MVHSSNFSSNLEEIENKDHSRNTQFQYTSLKYAVK